MAIGKTNCKIVNHRGRRKPAIGNWQLAIGKTNCKGFNHKGHEGNTKEEQKQKYTTEHERGWKPAVSSEPLFVYATADLP
jgi:hypothetical protein